MKICDRMHLKIGMNGMIWTKGMIWKDKALALCNSKVFAYTDAIPGQLIAANLFIPPAAHSNK